MACRLTIDLSPPFSPALMPPEVYAELYRFYVTTYRAMGFALMGRTSPSKSPTHSPSPQGQQKAKEVHGKTKPSTIQSQLPPQSAGKKNEKIPVDEFTFSTPFSYAEVTKIPHQSPSVKVAPSSVKVTAPPAKAAMVFGYVILALPNIEVPVPEDPDLEIQDRV